MERHIKARFGVPTTDTVDYYRIYVYNSDDINPRELFTPYLKNRGGREDAIAKHVQEIRDGILKDNGMENIPPIIIDINTLQIVDGNCRFNALLSILDDELLGGINLRVMFDNIPEDKFDERVIKYNQGQKSWSTVDFIYNFSLRGNVNYTKFIDFCKSDDTLHKADGTIKPRYGAAALCVSTNDLKKSTLSITDEDIENGKETVFEAAEIRKQFTTDLKANGGGWYEPYLRAWAEFRGEISDISFKDYLKEVNKSVKCRKREVTVPYGSNKKKDWNSFFRTIKTYVC